MEQIHPKDLFYQILDGIRSLTLYDHSSALLIREEDESALRVVAEQIAWTKAKSERIGLRIPMSEAAGGAAAVGTRVRLRSARATPGASGAISRSARWRRCSTTTAMTPPTGENVREASMLCVPLVTRDSLVGVLKIAARHAEQLKPFDAELVEHFRSQAAIAIQNLHRTESLRARVVTAERKHAMADLARSVSHDLNNALGSMLPLIQQMQADLQRGALSPTVFGEDLEHVQKSLQVCRRIFGGMLTFSRNAARRSGFGHVRRAIDTALAILKYGMSRSAIELHMNVPDDVPEVACSQSDLEQVFLNLLTNAREATPHGGRIMVTARSVDRRVEISIADTRMRDRRGEPAAGARAVLHDEAAWQRPRPLDLPLGPVGSRGHADDSQRARQRHRGAHPGSRPLSHNRTRNWHEVRPHPRRRRRTGHASRGRAGLERRASGRRDAARPARRWRSPTNSARSWRLSTSGCRISTASS